MHLKCLKGKILLLKTGLGPIQFIQHFPSIENSNPLFVEWINVFPRQLASLLDHNNIYNHQDPIRGVKEKKVSHFWESSIVTDTSYICSSVDTAVLCRKRSS